MGIVESSSAAALLAVTVPALRWYLCRRMARLETGEQRRSLHPPDTPAGPGAAEALALPDVEIHREVHTLKDGRKAFCQVICPKQPPSHILIWIHGFMSHSDMYLLGACRHHAAEGALVVMPDLPGMGRSDGLLGYVPDWWGWVEQVWEILELALPRAQELAGGKAPLRVFAGAISLGGGLLACLTVQRPTFFDGVVLIAPMLHVSEEVKPHWFIQLIFKNLLKPLLPTWPVTPSKPIDEQDFRVPEQGVKYTLLNPLSMQGCKPRLGTAFEMVFTFPDWMKRNSPELRTPFLIMHGTEDKETDPEASKRLYEAAKATDKTIRLLEGAYHCELMCCLPEIAKLIGVQWLPEQVELTDSCMKEMNAWIRARC